MHARLRKLQPIRERLQDESGMTLVEVIVSMLLVGLIALSFTGLDAAGRTTADQRRVAQATQVAQLDQERLRGLSADQLATLNETREVTLDQNVYTVKSTGKYQSGAAGSDSCASTTSAADYARVTTEVDWTANTRNPVILTSLITPRVGGSLVVQAIDQGGGALPGVQVTATGTDEDTASTIRSGTTDDGGCVIFGSLAVGTYDVKATLAGYIDDKGATAPTQAITTTSGNSTNLTFKLGQPGRIINATFQAQGATTVANQTAPAMSWNNTNMLTPGVFTPASPATSISSPSPNSIFPFIAGSPTTFTDNYQVWAGACTAAMPPATPAATAAARTFVTVTPGSTVTPPVVKMPLMRVVVTYGGSTSYVKPANIKFTDPCGTPRSFTSSNGGISSASSIPATGWLANPGQLYGTHTSICADYDPPGSTSSRERTVSSLANTSFTANNTVTISLSSSSTSGFC